MRRLLIIGMPVASGSWCSRRSSRPPAACLRPPSQQPEPLCPAVLTLLNAGWNLCKLFVIKLALRGETSDESTDARRKRHQPTWIWAHHFHLVVGGPRASRHQCPDPIETWQPRSFNTKQHGQYGVLTKKIGPMAKQRGSVVFGLNNGLRVDSESNGRQLMPRTVSSQAAVSLPVAYPAGPSQVQVQVQVITQPSSEKSKTMRVTRQLGLPPEYRRG